MSTYRKDWLILIPSGLRNTGRSLQKLQKYLLKPVEEPVNWFSTQEKRKCQVAKHEAEAQCQKVESFQNLFTCVLLSRSKPIQK